MRKRDASATPGATSLFNVHENLHDFLRIDATVPFVRTRIHEFDHRVARTATFDFDLRMRLAAKLVPVRTFVVHIHVSDEFFWIAKETLVFVPLVGTLPVPRQPEQAYLQSPMISSGDIVAVTTSPAARNPLGTPGSSSVSTSRFAKWSLAPAPG